MSALTQELKFYEYRISGVRIFMSILTQGVEFSMSVLTKEVKFL